MNILVKSRAKARSDSYASANQTTRKAIISISTPGDTQNTFDRGNRSIKKILYLQFHDIGMRDSEGIPISDKDVQEIVEFVHWCEIASIKEIWVHCDAGISRSSGVAAALMKYFNGDDSPIFDNPRYVPNSGCYFKVLEALMREREVRKYED